MYGGKCPTDNKTSTMNELILPELYMSICTVKFGMIYLVVEYSFFTKFVGTIQNGIVNNVPIPRSKFASGSPYVGGNAFGTPILLDLSQFDLYGNWPSENRRTQIEHFRWHL